MDRNLEKHVIGKDKETLVKEHQSKDNNEATFNSSAFPNGINIYRLQTDGNNNTKRLKLNNILNKIL